MRGVARRDVVLLGLGDDYGVILCFVLGSWVLGLVLLIVTDT